MNRYFTVTLDGHQSMSEFLSNTARCQPAQALLFSDILRRFQSHGV
jgi:hypothetical protein